MEKHLQVCAVKRDLRPVMMYILTAINVFDLLYVLILCLDFSKSCNDFSFQKVNIFKTKIIKTAEKEPD